MQHQHLNEHNLALVRFSVNLTSAAPEMMEAFTTCRGMMKFLVTTSI